MVSEKRNLKATDWEMTRIGGFQTPGGYFTELTLLLENGGTAYIALNAGEAQQLAEALQDDAFERDE